MRNLSVFLIITSFSFSSMLQARITLVPYFSYRSTKSIDPAKDRSSETEKVVNKEEKGLRASVGFYKLFKLQASVGQSVLDTTKSSRQIVDEYGEIDFQQDLNIDQSGETRNFRQKETDNRASVSVSIDPSFSIFIARAKLAVIARQRLVKVYEDGVLVLDDKPPITYKPEAGFGFGVKLTRRIYAIAEYSFYHYKFPEVEPFERSMTLNVGISI